MVLFPYRVKNPPNSFPYLTLAIIAINFIVWAFTSNHFLTLKEEYTYTLALRWGVSPWYTLFTSMFLHGDIMHIIGNMFAFWLFGPSVEDRFGKVMFLIMYICAGATGDLLQEVFGSSRLIGVATPNLGASGCVMGVMGAYLYAFRWSKVCTWVNALFVFNWIFEIRAIWVIGFFFAGDVYDQFKNGADDPVAHFAHIGGVIIGALSAMLLRVKVDSFELSHAKAQQAEFKDLSRLTALELRNLLEGAPEREDILAEYARKSLHESNLDFFKHAIGINRQAVVEKAPDAVAFYIDTMKGEAKLFKSSDLVKVARSLESQEKPTEAVVIYDTAARIYPDTMDAEIALFRSAMLLWRNLGSPEEAVKRLDYQLVKFPVGNLKLDAEDLKKKISKMS